MELKGKAVLQRKGSIAKERQYCKGKAKLKGINEIESVDFLF